MAITVVCSCGRTTRVDDRLKGRWVRCVGCGSMVAARPEILGQGSDSRASSAPPPSVSVPPPIPAAPPGFLSSRTRQLGTFAKRFIDGCRRPLRKRPGWTLVVGLNALIVGVAGAYFYKERSSHGQDPGALFQPNAVNHQPVQLVEGGANPRVIDQAKDGPRRNDVELSTREIVARCEESVAQIKGRFGSGSGFIVQPGYLATNAHVIGMDLSSDLRVHFPSRKDAQKGPYRATLVHEDVARDLAIFRIDVPIAALTLAVPYAFRRGEDITMIGSPAVGPMLSLENAVSRGVLSTEVVLGGKTYYQLGASVNPGNSGGPAIDSKGQVVGVVTLKARQEESIGFCVPVDDLAAAINRAKLVKPEEARALSTRHSATTIFKRLTVMGAIAILTVQARADQAREIFSGAGDGSRFADRLETGRLELAEAQQVENDGYRAAAADVLDGPGLPDELRRDLRALWSIRDDLQTMALDSRANLQSLGERASPLATRYGALVERLKRDLIIVE